MSDAFLRARNERGARETGSHFVRGGERRHYFLIPVVRPGRAARAFLLLLLSSSSSSSSFSSSLSLPLALSPHHRPLPRIFLDREREERASNPTSKKRLHTYAMGSFDVSEKEKEMWLYEIPKQGCGEIIGKRGPSL